MKLKRLLSTILVLATVLTCLPFIAQTASARIIDNTDKLDESGNPSIKYTSSDGAFATREAKLESMLEVKTVGGYTIFYEAYTGEVAIREDSTGNVLFTNPYDISDKYCKASNSTKEQLLSQIILTYLDNEELKTMYSYEEAAERDQIIMKDIKNGIRVEYAIGEDAIQRLVPRMISVERFNRFILDPLKEKAASDDITEANAASFALSKIESYYELKDINQSGLSERQIKEMVNAFPIVETMAIYVCETNIKAEELKRLEAYVKTYCQKYTYEELDYDNQECGFSNTDQVPPRFAMALEYTITDTGVAVSLPANGISFDEELYQLQDVTILPYMGAGSNQYEGYTFLPDGSGAIFDYTKLKDTIYNVSGLVYGNDYAYQTIEGSNEQTMRFPVFGNITNYSKPTDAQIDPAKVYEDFGFLAVITEGDAMATIATDHGGALHPYNTVNATFTPRPSDTYNLADSISEISSAEWTVTSSRRYTQRYTINYIMLSGEDKGNGYEASYYGMAEAYRDYLTSQGLLEKLESDDKGLTSVIETFGNTTGTKRVLSFPVTVDVPLTTFEDIKTMTDELQEAGMENISYKMTGYTNGGLDCTSPVNLSWQSSLGGNNGIKDLVEYAAEKGINLYPEFDYGYITQTGAFDGISLKSDAVKTIDGRYARKQAYDSGYQSYTYSGGTAISASVLDRLWSKFSAKYNSYNIGSISLANMGSDLNSDFDKDDPYHREDTKTFVENFLMNVTESNKLMISGGNAFAMPYADVITDVSLTSSEYINSTATVPFTGLVLHGSKTFTGSPLNMEGDIPTAILRSIENGAAAMFTLSYENTESLMDSLTWNKYYSIAYDIWKDDVVKYYKTLDDAIGDLQDEYITEHRFLDASRIPTEDETAADEAAKAEVDKINAEGSAAAAARYQLAIKRAERLGEAAPAERNYRYTDVTIDLTSKYATESGSVILVGYEDGTQFILNYNSYDITVELDGQTYTVEATNFVKIG